MGGPGARSSLCPLCVVLWFGHSPEHGGGYCRLASGPVGCLHRHDRGRLMVIPLLWVSAAPLCSPGYLQAVGLPQAYSSQGLVPGLDCFLSRSLVLRMGCRRLRRGSPLLSRIMLRMLSFVRLGCLSFVGRDIRWSQFSSS